MKGWKIVAVVAMIAAQYCAGQSIAPSQIKPGTFQNGTYNFPGTVVATQLGTGGGLITDNYGSQTIKVWGNSQTQGYGLPGCTTLTCHPSTAWPAVFAAAMGWTLDNQAYGSSLCADLTYSGTSESFWDQVITTSSKTIFGHFRNDQSQYGTLPYRQDIAKGCIQGLTAWAAIPESRKVRGMSSAVTRSGTWASYLNSADAGTTTAGATWTAQLTGKTIYLWAAKWAVGTGGFSTYTVSVDGNLVYDPVNRSTTLSQWMDCPSNPSANACNPGFPNNESISPYLIRVSGLADTTHTVVYTCVSPVSGKQCELFGAAGVSTDESTASGPIVYSLSPVKNAPSAATGLLADSVTSAYYDLWRQDVSELRGDGLNIIGLDATNPAVYDPSNSANVQGDGIHPSVAGHAMIAAAMISKASLASTSSNHGELAAQNGGSAYGSFGAGPTPSIAAYTDGRSTGPATNGLSIPPGSTWTSTAYNTGQQYFGYDGTLYLDRAPATTFHSGDEDVRCNQITYIGIPCWITTTVKSWQTGLTDSSGGFKVQNEATGAYSVHTLLGSTAYGVSSWVNRSVFDTNAANGRTYNVSSGASHLFTVNRSAVAQIDGNGVTIGANGTAYKLRQMIDLTSGLCTAAANSTCTFTLTFPKAFPDTAWHFVCFNEASQNVGILWGNYTTMTTTSVALAWRDLGGASNALQDIACEGFE